MAFTVSNAQAQPKPGMGSLGAHLGVPYFYADSDVKNGERPRILGQFHFQYKASPRWRLSSEFGFGWIGYNHAAAPYKMLNPATGDSVSTKEDVLYKFVPITLSALYSLRPNSTKWAPYVGGGLNLTRMEIVNRRQKIQDPATFQPWIKWSPGIQGEVGAELFMQSKKTVSLDWSLRGDYQLSKDTKHFPSGWTGNDGYVALNFGVNVYFWAGGQKPIEIAPAAAPAPAAPAAPATPEPAPTPAPTPPATPDTTHVPPPPAPTPATPDTTHAPTPPPTPPAPTPATPDTTKHAPAPQSAPASAADEGGATFGAFGVPLPAVEPAAACPVPTPAAAVTPRREEVVEPR